MRDLGTRAPRQRNREETAALTTASIRALPTRSTARMMCSVNRHRPRVRLVRPTCHASLPFAASSASWDTAQRRAVAPQQIARILLPARVVVRVRHAFHPALHERQPELRHELAHAVVHGRRVAVGVHHRRGRALQAQTAPVRQRRERRALRRRVSRFHPLAPVALLRAVAPCFGQYVASHQYGCEIHRTTPPHDLDEYEYESLPLERDQLKAHRAPRVEPVAIAPHVERAPVLRGVLAGGDGAAAHPAQTKHDLCHFPNAVRTCDAKGEIGEAHPGQRVPPEVRPDSDVSRNEGGRPGYGPKGEVDDDDAAAASSSSCRRRARSASRLVVEAPSEDMAAFRGYGFKSDLAFSSACMAAASAASSDIRAPRGSRAGVRPRRRLSRRRRAPPPPAASSSAWSLRASAASASRSGGARCGGVKPLDWNPYGTGRAYGEGVARGVNGAGAGVRAVSRVDIRREAASRGRRGVRDRSERLGDGVGHLRVVRGGRGYRRRRDASRILLGLQPSRHGLVGSHLAQLDLGRAGNRRGGHVRRARALPLDLRQRRLERGPAHGGPPAGAAAGRDGVSPMRAGH